MIQQKKNDRVQPHWQAMFRLFSGLQYLFKLGPLAFAAVGAFLIFSGSVNLYKAYQSTSWPSVQGVITVSRMGVDTSTSTTGTGIDRRTSTTTSYAAEIAFDYRIDNEPYSNNEVIAGGQIGTGSVSRARQTLNKYPEGAVVRVFYNPVNPYQSVLEPGIHLQSLLMPGFGIALVIVGLLSYRFLQRYLGFFQYLHKAVQQNGQPEPQPAQPEQRFARRSMVQENNIVGSWRVINQIPSYQELAKMSMKHWGISESDAMSATVIAPGESVVEISQNQIEFKVQGMTSAMNLPPSNYTKQGNRLVLGPIKTGLLTKSFAAFFPSYYQYAFDGSQLILTTDEIKGYDNQAITFFLERA